MKKLIRNDAISLTRRRMTILVHRYGPLVKRSPLITSKWKGWVFIHSPDSPRRSDQPRRKRSWLKITEFLPWNPPLAIHGQLGTYRGLRRGRTIGVNVDMASPSVLTRRDESSRGAGSRFQFFSTKKFHERTSLLQSAIVRTFDIPFHLEIYLIVQSNPREYRSRWYNCIMVSWYSLRKYNLYDAKVPGFNLCPLLE